MVEQSYTLKITLDGADVKSEAQALRQAIEAQLETITIAGKIDLAGLDGLVKQMGEVRKQAGSLGRAMAEGMAGQWGKLETTLASIQSQITGIVRAGKGIAGIELPLGQDVEQLLNATDKKAMRAIGQVEELTVDIKRLAQERADLLAVKVTPLSGGVAMTMAELARGFEPGYKAYISKLRNQITRELEQTMIEVDGKQVNLLKELQRRQAEEVNTARAAIPALEEAYKAAEERVLAVQEQQPFVSSTVPQSGVEISRYDAQADALLARYEQLNQKLETLAGDARAAAEKELAAVIAQAQAMDAIAPDEEVRAWVADFEKANDEFLTVANKLQATRSVALTGDTDTLALRADARRRELEGAKAGELLFWEEWNMDQSELVRRLEKDGQTEAAQAIVKLQGMEDRLDQLRKKREAELAKAREGTTAELPADAKGTLVDFVTAERALGDVADGVTESLRDEYKILGRLVTRLDEAALAAAGLSKSQRVALGQLESAAQKELRAGSKGRGLEDTGEQARSVLARLATEAAAVQRAMADAVDAPDLVGEVQAFSTQIQAALRDLVFEVEAVGRAIALVLAGPQAEAATEKATGGILGKFRELADKLVGHSIVPDMVNDINAWLDQIGLGGIDLDALAGPVEARALAVVTELQDIAAVLPVEEVQTRVALLQAEIRALGDEFTDLTVKETSAAVDYKRAQFETGVNEARRLRGYSPEDEAQYAAGYLPRGIGTGNETRYDKGLGRGDFEETTDEWYRVVNTDIETKVRYTQAQNEQIAAIVAEMESKEAQMAALVGGLAQQMTDLSAMLEVTADPVEAESLFTQMQAIETALETLEGSYTDVADAKVRLVEQTAMLAGMDAEAAAAEAAAYYKTAEGRVELARTIAETRAEVAAQLDAARTANRVQIEQEKQATAILTADAKERLVVAQAEAQAKTEAAKQTRAVAQAEAQAQRAQKTEAARRQTVKARGAVTVKVADEKSKIKAAAEYNRLLATAQKLAGGVGLSWAQVEQEMSASGQTLAEVVGGLQRVTAEQKAAEKAAAATAKLTGDMQKRAAALGIPWAEVETAMRDSGLSLQQINGALQKTNSEMRAAQMKTDVWERVFSAAEIRAQGLAQAISDARNKYQGITQLAGDLQSAGSTLQQTGTVITGSLTAAGTQFLDFSKTVGVAARAVGLSAQQTEVFEQVIVDMTGSLALVDAGTLAEGAITWAKAIGQTAESEDDMRRILEQTIPAQKIAALSGEDLTMVLEGGANALRQFNLPVSELESVLAVIKKAADSTTSDIASLNEGLKYLGPSANALGVPLEDVVAALSILAEAGQQGSMSGRGLGQAFSDIVNPTDKAAGKLEELFGAAQPFFRGGEFVGFPEMIDLWADALAGLSDEERQAALGTVFDQNAARAMLPLIEAQIAARGRGINSLRAFSKNMQGVTDSETQAWAAMRLETEGVVVDTTGALQKLQQEWDSYTESDARRVDVMKARWQQFWLTIGAQAVDVVLPQIIKITEQVDRMVAIAESHPALTGAAVALGGGMLAVGTLINLMASAARSAIAIKSVVDGLKAWGLKRAGADAKFQATVVSAAEQFRLIVTQAAGQAAATEGAGAAAESGTELAGAQAEVAIETAGAGGKGLLGAAGALALPGAIVAGGALAGRAIDQAGQETTGRGLGQNWRELVSVMSYGMGSLIGQGEEFFNFTNRGMLNLGIGAEVFESDASSADYSDAGMKNALARVQELGLAAEATALDVATLSAGLEQAGNASSKVAVFTEQQINAAKLYADYLKAQADATADFNAQLRDLNRDLQKDLADLASEYHKNRAQAEADFYTEQAKAADDYARQQVEAAAQHARDMQRAAEDHALKMRGFAESRDAAAAYEEREQYALATARAGEDFTAEQAQAAQEEALARAQRQADFAQQLLDMDTQYQTARAQRVLEYQTQVGEAQVQHADEMNRLRQEYFDKINAELQYYTDSRAQSAAWQAAMLADAQGFLTQNKALWDAYYASMPQPRASTVERDRYEQYQRAQRGYATGGWVAQTGPALVHAGEYVVNREQARDVAPMLGGGGGRGNIVINNAPTFSNVSAADQSWIRAELARNSEMVLRAVTEVLQ